MDKIVRCVYKINIHVISFSEFLIGRTTRVNTKNTYVVVFQHICCIILYTSLHPVFEQSSREFMYMCELKRIQNTALISFS